MRQRHGHFLGSSSENYYWEFGDNQTKREAESSWNKNIGDISTRGIHAEMLVKANVIRSLSLMRLVETKELNYPPPQAPAQGGALGAECGGRFACYANPSCPQCLAQRLLGALTLQFHGEYHVKTIAHYFHRNKKQKTI